MKDRPDSAAKGTSPGPDARLESVGQADPALREGPVSRGRLTFIIIAVIVVLVWMWWALVGTHQDMALTAVLTSGSDPMAAIDSDARGLSIPWS